MLQFVGLGNLDEEDKSPNFRVDEDGKVYKRGHKKFPNGDRYDGEFVGSINNREGQGRMVYMNGNVYVGHFKNDRFDGFGLYVWAHFQEGNITIKGRRYEGHWKEGKMDGLGSYWLGTGDFYEGNFKNSLYHGEGTLSTRKGDTYSGTWERGKMYGENNVVKFLNKDKYEGAMFASKFNGYGKYTWSRGLGSYKGQWRWGKQHGQGQKVYANGNRFEGTFINSEPHGEGIMTYINGDQYAGDWKHGRFCGHGVLTFAHGDRYEGEFLDGVYYGRGKYTYADGGWYEGDYLGKLPYKYDWDHKVEFPRKDGKKCGKGIRVWANGNKYEGDWDYDAMHGKGVWTNIEGHRYNGEFASGHRHGQGELQCGNKYGAVFHCFIGNKHNGDGHCTYKGSFCRGEFDGKGTYTCIDGRRYDGEWKLGKRHGNGTQVFMKHNERGDPANFYIGGMSSLYRALKYTGDWDEDERHGSGTLEYQNGDLLIGRFVRGHCHGKAVYVFGKSFTFKVGIWEMGKRKSWEQDDNKDAFTKNSSLAVLFKKKDKRAASTDVSSNDANTSEISSGGYLGRGSSS